MGEPRKPLTEAQEARLIRHLDQELLKLSGAYESRHALSSPLQTLGDFLDAIVPLHSFILSIPAAPPSSSIRVSYFLQLTGFLAPALDGYTLLDETLDHLFLVLSRFDAGWVAVLRGQEWDSSVGAARAGDSGSAGGEMRTTDRVRLESLIKEIKAVLAVSLGLPEFVPLENDPFQELLKQQKGRSAPVRLEELHTPASRQAQAGEDAEMQPASGSATPSLVSDAGEDDSMSVDTAVATPSSASLASDLEEEEGSDSEFEEVAVSGPPLTAPLPSDYSSTAHLLSVSAYADSPAADGSFAIHFTGPPPPTLQDGEVSLQGGTTPIVGQARGFDPDEEYPPEEEIGERVGEGDVESEIEEDGIEEGVRERVNRVFEGAAAVLDELRTSAG
ncbi:hypothetical protein JCM10213_002555 [Rhodosporidiobolus nylandii]